MDRTNFDGTIMAVVAKSALF